MSVTGSALISVSAVPAFAAETSDKSETAVTLKEGTYAPNQVVVKFKDSAIDTDTVPKKGEVEAVGADFGELADASSSKQEALGAADEEADILSKSLGGDFVLEDTTANDVYAICTANGIKDRKDIDEVIRDAEDCDFDLSNLFGAVLDVSHDAGLDAAARVRLILQVAVFVGTHVLECDGDTGIQIGQFTHTFGDDVVFIFGGGEYGTIRPELLTGTCFVCIANNFHVVEGLAFLVFLLVDMAVAEYL